MTKFHTRQAGLLGVVILGLLVATAASGFFRGLVIQPFVGPPTYLNPGILFAIVLFGLMGLLTMFRAGDGGWPWFTALVGLWIFVIAVEDSLLQWFVFQLGAATTGGRVNPMLIAASGVAIGASAAMHANQLGRQIRDGLAERGLDPRELEEIEDKAFNAGLGLAGRLAGIVAAAGVMLFVGEFILGPRSIGIGALGILGGIVIVSIIAVLAYGVLKQGPAPELGPEGAAERREERARRGSGGPRSPPSGLRPR